MFWKTPKFKALEAQWYDRLEEAGFKDIEEEEEDRLNQWAANVYRQTSRVVRHAKEEYYLQLSHYLREKTSEFDDGIDYFVMHRTSLGHTATQIVRELARLGKPRHRKTIMYIRRKYESRWEIRKWESHQLTSQRMPRKKT